MVIVIVLSPVYLFTIIAKACNAANTWRCT